jgi:hypothetical protein
MNKTKSQLERWLRDPRAQAYFGKNFAMKLDVLSAMLFTGESLGRVALRHHKCRSAVYDQAAKLRRIFGECP